MPADDHGRRKEARKGNKTDAWGRAGSMEPCAYVCVDYCGRRNGEGESTYRVLLMGLHYTVT